MEDGFEVPLLRPPDEGEGVILSLGFVGIVVAPGTIGTGYLEAKLLFVEIAPLDVQPNNANEYDAAAFAAHLGGLGNYVVALGGGGDQDGIGPYPVGLLLDDLHGVLSTAYLDGVDAPGAGELDLAGVEIQADHPTAVGFQQLAGDQTDEAETGDHYRFPESGCDQADALQGDGSDDGKGSFVVRNPLRYLGHQVLRYADDLRVVAVGDDAVADLEVRHPFSYRNHLTGIAVAQRQGLAELTKNGLQSGLQAVGLNLVQHLQHLLGLLPCLVDEVGLAEVDQHLLGPERHERAVGFDEYVPRADLGNGNVS